MPSGYSFLRSGYLLPRILLFWAVLDLGLRFAPPQWYTFRLHEFAMVTGSHDLGPFRTNLNYENAHAYGDLSELSNCVECREYRTMNVRIDARGFANPASSRPYDAIMVGDSFCIGAEQGAGENLASQISERTGLWIYNACSPIRSISRERLLALIDQLAMSRGTVFFELMDWSLGNFQAAQQDPGFNGLDRWSKNLQYSPLANISRELVGRLYDGRIMPNPYTGNVVRKQLHDGRPILFQLDDVRDSSPDGPKLWATYFQVLDRELRIRNFKLVVVLVPSKYTVYQSVLESAPPTNKSAALEELRAQLPGIPVVNTTPALRRAAADALKTNALLYWRDDTHWNRDGVGIAAEQVAAAFTAEVANPAPPKLKSVSENNVP